MPRADLLPTTLARLLQEGAIAQSKIPMTVRLNKWWKQMEEAGTIEFVRRGSGRVYDLVCPEAVRRFLADRYPDYDTLADDGTAITHARRYRDSKAARRTDTQQVALLRGWSGIEIDGRATDLARFTEDHALLALAGRSLRCERLCFVENLDVFMRAEEVLGRDFVFLHAYGRVGKPLLRSITAETVVHWGDYDYVGLKEYLTVKQVFAKASLYVPADLEVLWGKFSRQLKPKARASEAVLRSALPEVIRIRELLTRTNAFVEQQILFPAPHVEQT